MTQSITDFIKEKVYPDLDAVDAGLLNHLKPRKQGSNGAYPLTCPSCGHDEAFYYPFRTGISCNRKKNCDQPWTGLWDALSKNGMSNGDIVATLCKSVGVEPPRTRRDNPSDPNQPAERPALTPGRAIMQVTQRLAANNQHILATFQKSRGYTDADMKEMKFGVYTTVAEVQSMLAAAGISNEVARDRGYFSYTDEKPDHLYSGLEGRVIGYWPHSDGDVRLWGRIPVGPGVPKINPKYRFAPTLSKEIPYLFGKRMNSILVCVEGTLDGWALQLLGEWGCAVGQSLINQAQAVYLASQGITEAAQMIDGDRAGYEGALSSIRACESVGITLGIVTLGEGMDDADAMRKEGRGDEIKTLIANRINAGEYLARMCVHYMSLSPPDLRAIARVRQVAQHLTPVSKHRWIDFSESLGVYVDEEAEAVRVLAGLISGGMSLEDGLHNIQRHRGISISMNKEPAHG